MVLLVFLSLLGIIIFGIIAIWLSIKEERTKKLLVEREEIQKQRIYEISILREIQERIGYELDLEKVADVITGSLINLFSYSTSSSLLLKNDKLIFKTYAQERVSHVFIQQVKKTTMASLAAISDKTLPADLEEITTGVILDDQNTLPVGSFFNIPLIIDNEVMGIINISSTKPGLYKEDQMTILYQITNLSSTAITRLRELLRTEKGKLVAMISSLADGVFMVNTKKQMQTINQTAKNIMAIQKDEPAMMDVAQAIGNNFDLSSMIDEVLTTKKSLPMKELMIHDKNIQLFITPVMDGSHQALIGASVLLHDVTLEKNLEQMKDDFTSMMVHELRAPLTAIRGASALMQSAKDQLTDIEKEKLLTITTEQSTKLLDIVGTILDAAKLEAGKFVLQKSPTDLNKIVEQSVALFTTQAESKHIVLTCTDQPILPMVSLDALRFGEVMNNLLSNAIKYTPENGKVTVSIKKQTSNNNVIQIYVSDTGIGIPKDKQASLFSKFYQVKHEKADLGYIVHGTGLGLYIVKGIIEAHGGSVTVASEIGQGTIFTITIPLVTVQSASPLPPPTPFPSSRLAV